MKRIFIHTLPSFLFPMVTATSWNQTVVNAIFSLSTQRPTPPHLGRSDAPFSPALMSSSWISTSPFAIYCNFKGTRSIQDVCSRLRCVPIKKKSQHLRRMKIPNLWTLISYIRTSAELSLFSRYDSKQWLSGSISRSIDELIAKF